MLFDVSHDIIGAVTAALGYRGIELGTQRGDLRLLDGEANGVLGGREDSRRDFGFHPVGSVRCEFHFHEASIG